MSAINSHIKPLTGYKRPRFSPNSHAIIAGVLSSLAYLYMAFVSRNYGDLNLNQMLSVSAFCAGLSFWVWYVHDKQNKDVGLVTLIGFSVLFRLIGGSTFPILEDDFYRYLWDARMTVETGSPYGIAPAEFFTSNELNEKFESILDRINYPFIETIYGPTCQFLFALAYLVSPGEIWPLQLLIGLADMVVILLLLKLAKPTSVLLYAWSPLVIKEFVITTHPDVLGVLLMVLALLMLSKRRVIYAGVCMGLACGVKVFAILLLPFLLRFEWKAWLAFGATVALISLPFGFREAWIPEGLSAMSSNWLFNAPLYLLADITLGGWVSLSTVKLTLLGLFATACAVYLAVYLKKGPNVNAHQHLRGDILYAGLLLCTPVLNPWYLVWLLPFAVFRPSAWAWFFSVTILVSYASGINLNGSGLEPYQHWGWVLALEFTPPLIMAAALGATRYFLSVDNNLHAK